MKNNRGIIAVIIVGFLLSSCSVLNGGKQVSEKERIEVDAYAKANIECEYKLANLQYQEDKTNKKLKLARQNIKEEALAFRRLIHKKYGDVGDTRIEFNKLVKSSEKYLSVCVKYEELIKSIEDKKKSELKK